MREFGFLKLAMLYSFALQDVCNASFFLFCSWLLCLAPLFAEGLQQHLLVSAELEECRAKLAAETSAHQISREALGSELAAATEAAQVRDRQPDKSIMHRALLGVGRNFDSVSPLPRH